jgi:ATP-dependent DNA helicase 2 subunit 1
MPFEDWDKFDEPEDEELEDEAWYQGKRDAVLFAIECSDSMLRLRDDGSGNQKSHLQVALEGCRDIMKRKAAVAPTDYVGILVYNTAGSRVQSSMLEVNKNSC